MAELDVVEYVPDPSDARAKLVRFTPEGARAILYGLTVLRTLEAEMEAHIGKRKMHDLRGALDAMLAALEASEADEAKC